MKAGLTLESPDGRRFKECAESGSDSQGKPVVRLTR